MRVKGREERSEGSREKIQEKKANKEQTRRPRRKGEGERGREKQGRKKTHPSRLPFLEKVCIVVDLSLLGKDIRILVIFLEI